MNISDRISATEKRDAAHEIKFLVPAVTAETVLAWARHHLAPDPHAGSDDTDGYRVNSLYFDTTNLDVYRRKGSYGKSKYRVRRYGMETNIFLERKLKSRGLVSKRRTRVPEGQVLWLSEPEPEPAWIGFWFRRRLSVRQLRPQCQIRYRRVARVGMTPEGPIRLTIDRDVCAFPTGLYSVSEDGEWLAILPDQCILELKFRQDTPPLFQALTEQLSLVPQPVSKYRLSIQAFGLDAQLQEEPAPHTNGHVTKEALLDQKPLVRAETVAAPREA